MYSIAHSCWFFISFAVKLRPLSWTYKVMSAERPYCSWVP